MDRHRGGDRSYGGSNNGDSRRTSRFSDGGSSRFSDGPPPRNRYSDNGSGGYGRRSPNNYRGRDGGSHAFDSPPRHGPGSEGFRPMGGDDGGWFWPIGGGGGGGGAGFGPNYHGPPMTLPHPPISGQKRSFSGRGSSPDRMDISNFAKLFVGSVPRTATEEEIRPLFEEHGKVIEVALLKDKRTGQQQGCCFIKYATSEEADRAIKGLHNQRTLPGGVGPIQVRYADGERERLGAVEHKLFVGSLNKQASVKEVEEIFLPYGQVEDVYLMRDEMKQSRGCGFVKYAHRDMALAAINALNGIYRMRGCDQPLIVRFADPKKPRPGAGDARGPPSLNPTFGAPGFGPQFQGPVPRPGSNFGEPFDDRIPPNAWNLMSPQCSGVSPGGGPRGFGSSLSLRPADLTMPFNQGGNGPSDRVLPGASVPSATQQGFNPPLAKLPSINQQMSMAQRSLQSPQQLPTVPLHGQVPSSYSQTRPSHTGKPPFSQALPAQPALGLSGQLPTSQPQLQQAIQSTTAPHPPLNMNFQPHSRYPVTNQQPFPAPAQQQIPQPLEHSPSQLAQILSQQTQTLQATYNSSQQVFSQLQQQVQMMQPSNQNVDVQQGPQGSRQQPPSDIPPSTSAPATATANPNLAPMKCIWTEHTSPEGFKYYYNSTTRESKWEKPNELLLFEQQQLQQSNQQKPLVQQQPLNPSNPQGLFIQQAPPLHQQLHQAHLQAQFRHQQLQQPSLSAMEPAQLPQAAGSGNDPARFQGLPAAQEWMWKNKPTGT